MCLLESRLAMELLLVQRLLKETSNRIYEIEYRSEGDRIGLMECRSNLVHVLESANALPADRFWALVLLFKVSCQLPDWPLYIRWYREIGEEAESAEPLELARRELRFFFAISLLMAGECKESQTEFQNFFANGLSRVDAHRLRQVVFQATSEKVCPNAVNMLSQLLEKHGYTSE